MPFFTFVSDDPFDFQHIAAKIARFFLSLPVVLSLTRERSKTTYTFSMARLILPVRSRRSLRG
jgi:hypothetical protein